MNSPHEPRQLLCFSAMAGIFPGASSVDALWQRILEAQIAPQDDMTARWGIERDAILTNEPGVANRIYYDRAHCLPLAAETGHTFPWGHQIASTRTVLKQLLAQAGMSGKAFDGTDVALVLGTSWSDKSYFLADANDVQTVQGQGIDPAMQVQQLATTLGLTGPALAVDTACSSFAYALEMASNLITSGRARKVIVAGVNAFLPAALFLGFSQIRALSGQGKLNALGAEADGIVLGECVAAFLLETQESATQAQRPVLGLLRGLGLSSDGAEGSVFAPGKAAQLQAYGRAYQGLDPASIDYIEAHGTGTPVGDATELDSLDAFFREHFATGRRLPVGSIKSIIGHTLAAAGAAALVKSLLMLRHRTLPPHIAVTPNERISDSCLTLPTVATVFAPRERALRIGISSFGFGGANAHIVIEEAIDQPVNTKATESDTGVCNMSAAPANTSGGVVELDLAILDVEAAFGNNTSAFAWQQQLRAGVPGAQTFPARSFSPRSEAPALQGQFLRTDVSIDIAGYRMGPRPLSYIDPFKLLLTHRVKTMLTRQPNMIGALDTAMVVCANMGGERFFDAYRKITRFYTDSKADAPNLVVDDVPTLLPTMLSGYPAQILNLRGFHETISGAPGIFWTSLFSAPQWLKHRCSNLVLGAGRYISSRADLASASNTGGLHGEGVGLLAIKNLAVARASGERLLAVIRHAVFAAQAGTLDQARQLVGALAEGEHLEICELSPDAKTSYQGAQAYTGFLGEATGIEAILAALLHTGPRSVIEVRQQGTPLFWLFIENENQIQLTADAAPKLALTIRFSAEQAPASTTATDATNAINAINATPASAPELLTAEPATAGAVDHLMQDHLMPDNLGINKLAANKLMADGFPFITKTMLTSLRLRSRALERIASLVQSQAPVPAGPGLMRPLSATLMQLRKDQRNLVITQPCMVCDSLQATMVIDETHPYFFDHPLDHVPGILLLEGALQLTELALNQQAQQTQQAQHPMFINALSVRFRRYTEKQIPITLGLERTTANEYKVSMMQAGALVCECVLGVAALPAHAVGSSREHATATVRSMVEHKLLHKANTANVLVSELKPLGDQWQVQTIAVPPGHLFTDGHAQHFSMLYFLETARQCLMLVAHTRLGIPTGVPMNLVELRFTINAPIPRDVALSIVPTFQNQAWGGLMQTGRVSMALMTGQAQLGQAEIVAQVVDKELYALQRHAA